MNASLSEARKTAVLVAGAIAYAIGFVFAFALPPTPDAVPVVGILASN